MRKYILSLLIACTLLLNPLVVGASSSSESTDVSVSRSSNFTVTIPKKISMKVDGNKASASYTVSIEGDLAGSDIVKVTPPSTFNMTSNTKSVVATVTQEKDFFSLSDMSNLEGLIAATGLTAGDWVGYFHFNIDCTLSNTEQSTESTTDETLCSHNFEYADCTSLGTCTLCGASSASARGHIYLKDPCFCDFCGAIADGVDLVQSYTCNSGTSALCTHGTCAITGHGNVSANLKNENKGLVVRAALYDGVTSLAGFRDCSNLVSIDAADSVTIIDNNAFYNCASLPAYEVLREGITYIGSNAFTGCSSLGDVILPSTCTYYGSGVFAQSGMTTITIPSTFTKAGYDPWAGCPNFTKAIFAEGCTAVPLNMFSNCSALSEVVLPSTMVTINDGAFSGTGLTKINIPDSVTAIGSSAFGGCIGLGTLNVPSSVTSIGPSAFYNVPVVRYNGPATSGSPWGALSLVTE